MSARIDEKTTYLLHFHCEKLSSHTFDETDLLTLIVLSRQYLNPKDQGLIRDFGDLIAHRRRNRGIAIDAIIKADSYGYSRINNNGRTVIRGYKGIDETEWKTEWIRLGQRFNCVFDDKTIQELSLCAISLLQFTEYERKVRSSKLLFWKKRKIHATINLLQSDDKKLIAYTIEDKSKEPVVFMCLNNVDYKIMYPGRTITDPVIAVRDNGTLILQNNKGNRII